MIKNILAAVLLSLVVFVIAGVGFYLVGSPSETRGVKYDTLRVQDIGKIKYAIEDYYRYNKKMPGSLDDLLIKDSKNYSNKAYLEKELKDPKTGKVYDYKDSGGGKYQLCADFETSTEDIQERKTGVGKSSSLLSPYSYSNENRLHPKGNYCYEYNIAGFIGDSSKLIDNSYSGSISQPLQQPQSANAKNTLIVQSNASAVPISGSQIGTTGTTNYTLSMDSDIDTVLTAPPTINGQSFSSWSGCVSTGNQCFAKVSGGAAYTVIANYSTSQSQ